MMKQSILTLAIFMAIVSSAENEERNGNFNDLIVHYEKTELMDNIGKVSEAIPSKIEKVSGTEVFAPIFKVKNGIAISFNVYSRNLNSCLNDTNLHLVSWNSFMNKERIW
ncbi:hypothetical protein ACFSKL_11385 [Belliella marina]|uniref:Uncharacterized protein n=1 Tax=Belliella marina TaxID=1644146 RepID=A0ABW4VMN1_9BACT